MRRIAVSIAVAGTALLIVSAAVAAPQPKALTASAELAPQSFLFGQTVRVRIDAIVDRRRLDPSHIRLDVNWRPYTEVTPTRFRRSDAGRYSRLTWRVALHCVALECVPRVGSNVRNVFEPATLRYVPGKNDSRTTSPMTISWPNVIAWSRLDPIDTERKANVRTPGTVIRRQNAAFVPPWHVDTNLAAVSYSARPNVLMWMSIVAAIALLAVAVFLARPWLPAFVFGRRPEPSSLDRALAAVERARGENIEERKALELLAAELRTSGEEGLAWAASELAWSSDRPEPDRTDALTATVRDAFAERTNGHRA